jgi:TusA-related sulfurtransferase
MTVAQAIPEGKEKVTGNEEAEMSSNAKLDLTEVFWPESLFQCKSTLAALDPGNEIDILVNDLDVVKNLSQIIEHSQCTILNQNRTGNFYLMHVRKI